MVPKAEVISILVIMISSWNFWTCAARNLLHHTMSDVFLLWQKTLTECECYSSIVGWILVNAIFGITFRIIIKGITGRRLLVGPSRLQGFCKAVTNLWPTLIYSCFAKMLLEESAMKSCNSVGTYFRSSGGIWTYPGALLFRSLRMLLAISSSVVGVSRGLGLSINGSSFDSLGSLTCALTWSLMIL